MSETVEITGGETCPDGCVHPYRIKQLVDQMKERWGDVLMDWPCPKHATQQEPERLVDAIKCSQCGEEYIAGFRLGDGVRICIDCHKSNAEVLPAKPDDSHYHKGSMDPWKFIEANGLNFFEGSVVKYVTRWRHKNGVEDLKKARVYIDELIRQAENKP